MAMPTPIAATQPISPTSSSQVNALLGDFAWRALELTYSFPAWESSWSTDFALGYGSITAYGEPWNGFTPISTDEQAAFRNVADAWSGPSNMHLVETGETSASYGIIRIAKSARADAPFEYAWAYYPSSSERGGDIWMNTASPFVESPWVPGSAAYYTLLHEVGHALGLKHPFDGALTLDPGQDAISSTVMSYDAWAGSPQSAFDFYPTTPMRLDIAALQYLYGPPSGSTADDLYRFDDSRQYHCTLWDAGGNDTLSYDGRLDAIVDLRPGQGSILGKPVHAYEANTGALLGQPPNVWTAHDTVIERAILGSGNDTITVHAQMRYLDAGAGLDTLVLPGSASDYRLTATAHGFALGEATAPTHTLDLRNLERFVLDEIAYAADLGADEAAGKTLLAIRSAAPQYLDDPVTIGNVMKMFDTGLDLRAFFEALEADGTLDMLFAQYSDAQLANLLATNLGGGVADPDTATHFGQLLAERMPLTDVLAEAASSTPNLEFLAYESSTWLAIPFI